MPQHRSAADARHREAPSGRAPRHRFDLSGGSLCLDFANTVPDRPRRSKDYLASYADLLDWSRQAGLLAGGEVKRLAAEAARRPAAARAVFDRAISLREGLYRIFSALAAGRRAAPEDLAALNAALAASLSRLRLRSQTGTADVPLAWAWQADVTDLDRMLWQVVRSAGDLLTSPPAAAVRECASETCSWLFLDRSRTRRRRWCDMKTCGNRAKARRHYERLKRRRPTGRA